MNVIEITITATGREALRRLARDSRSARSFSDSAAERFRGGLPLTPRHLARLDELAGRIRSSLEAR